MDPDPPSTDAALVNGLAYVLITENMIDQPFLDKYCVGYDEKTLPADAPKNGHYKAYILGRAKTVSPRPRNGQRKLPVFLLIESLNWPVKSVALNRHISVRGGDRSAMLTVK